MATTAPEFVSVVMATYNHDRYLHQSIQSVLSQSYSNFELIIVNDNSKDTSDEIIKTIANHDHRIVYIKNDQNEKLSACRNKAIRMAKGEFVVIVDSDDICMPNRLQRQLDYFSSHPKCDVLGTSFCLFLDSNVDECKSVV